MSSRPISRKAAAQSKAKAKKILRKEEREKVDEYWQLVDRANKISDQMAPLVSFQHYKKNDLEIELVCLRKSDLSEYQMKWVFDLTKQNMEELYESSWGWSDKEKMQELYDDRMWYLFALQDGNPVGFSSFRYDLDFKVPVIYCYEIQLSASFTGKGLGTFMMQILQLLAIRNGMHKVMATILHGNEASTKFFMEKLKYQIDETSLVDECYDIVSKPVKKVRQPCCSACR